MESLFFLRNKSPNNSNLLLQSLCHILEPIVVSEFQNSKISNLINNILYSVHSFRSGGQIHRAEPSQLRQEDSDAVWNELAYFKSQTMKLSIEK